MTSYLGNESSDQKSLNFEQYKFGLDTNAKIRFGLSITVLKLNWKNSTSRKKIGPKSAFSIASDIWSLGLTIVELALGKYAIPAPTEAEINELMSLEEGTPPRKSEEIRHTIFELLMVIVDQEPPKLPNTHFSQGMVDFIDMCLQVRKCVFSCLQVTFLIENQF